MVSDDGEDDEQLDLRGDEITFEEESSSLQMVLRDIKNRDNQLQSPFKWEYVANWPDPNPFISYRCPVTSAYEYRCTTLQELLDCMYTTIGGSSTETRECKPPDAVFTTAQTHIHELFPDYLRNDQRGYMRVAGQDLSVSKVADISKQLYGLLPHSRDGLAYYQ